MEKGDVCTMRYRGLTLNELLVVVVIIGVLASFAVPATMSMMKDSSTHEFSTNAKVIEDASRMHYRDTGVLPTSEVVGSGGLSITENSKLVIRNELIKAGVYNSEDIVNYLIEDGYIRKLDYGELLDNSTVSKEDEGASEFVIIDMIEDIDPSRYGVYENDIAGFVFSLDVRDNSSNEMYSGAYKITSGTTSDDLTNEEGSMSDNALTDATSLKPYGFRVADVKNNKDGTADVTLTWTNRLTELVDGKETVKRGYVSEQYRLTCDLCSESSKSITDGSVEMLLEDVPMGKVKFTLTGTKVVFAGKDIPGNTRIANVNDTSDGVIDLIDVTTNPGEGVVDVNDGLDEVLEGDQFDNRNDLYKELEENPNFGNDKVVAVRDGLEISGLDAGDRLVLKEVRKTGTLYDFDPNRTRLFIVKKDTVLIPKDPYLQKDFQTNPYSEYQYIVEVYNNVGCSTCSGKTNPDNAVVVYYAE